VGIPVKLSDTPGALQFPPPRFGEHNRDVLRELGFDAGAIEQFSTGNIIAEAAPVLT
jgi:crotonobetainyl-CoA:carnitine CoA-transferase CaiB-like acyl-CoA transferase